MIKTDKKILAVRWIFIILTFAVMLIIFINSAKTAEQSTEISSTFSDKIFSVFVSGYTEMNETEKVEIIKSSQFIVRKAAHFSAYALLAFFCGGAIGTYSFAEKKKHLLTAAISVAYAASDEIHQLFVPGRAGRFTDVLIDSAGVAAGVLCLMLACHIHRKIIKRREDNEKKGTAC